VGDGVTGLQVGERVTSISMSLRKCHFCRRAWKAFAKTSGHIGFRNDGGLAEYVKVLPPMSFPSGIHALSEAAILTDRWQRLQCAQTAGQASKGQSWWSWTEGSGFMPSKSPNRWARSWPSTSMPIIWKSRRMRRRSAVEPQKDDVRRESKFTGEALM